MYVIGLHMVGVFFGEIDELYIDVFVADFFVDDVFKYTEHCLCVSIV